LKKVSGRCFRCGCVIKVVVGLSLDQSKLYEEMENVDVRSIYIDDPNTICGLLSRERCVIIVYVLDWWATCSVGYICIKV
jgi:hypothetical protein